MAAGLAFAPLDASDWRSVRSIDLRLQDPLRFAGRANRGAVPSVEAAAALLSFAELSRINCLQKPVPAQMHIEVRPVDK